ncbi:hypothetical protein OROHE_006825 [Orobanche hederae]
MDSKTLPHPSPLQLLLLLSASLFFMVAFGAGICINYGQIADNLPIPEKVVPLIKSINAARLRLYDADQRVLAAFANTGVEFTVGLGNEYLANMTDPGKALTWVKNNVQCYLPETKITSISVGNEVLTSNDPSLSSNYLLSAMVNIHAALVSLKLDKDVTVTTAQNFGILEVSYPPSAGAFRQNLTQILKSILDFHCKVDSPFMINAYPFFAYKDNPKIPLNYVLFEGDAIVDPISSFHYDNMFYAQIDAAYSAMAKVGYENVCLQVAETGWPSKGDNNETWASPENAEKYNKNLLKLINANKGTPMRPDFGLNVCVFALFNENLKTGPTSERNFGLFNSDTTPVYDLGFNVKGIGSTNSSISGGGTTPSTSSPGLFGSPDGLFNADDAVSLLSSVFFGHTF